MLPFPMFRSKTTSLPSPAPYPFCLPFSFPRISANFVPTVSSFPSVFASSRLDVNRHRIAPQKRIHVSPSLATLAGLRQLAENTATLSPAFATLTNRVKHKSCVCHSCKKTPGVGVRLLNTLLLHCAQPFPIFSTPGKHRSHRNTCNSNPLIGLLHGFLDTGGTSTRLISRGTRVAHPVSLAAASLQGRHTPPNVRR